MMMLEQDNPYRPPAIVESYPRQSQVSLLRGIVCALPAAVVGFALPFVPFSMLTLVRYYVFGNPRIDMDADFREMPSTLLWPGIGCSIVFGLAAVLNYSPATRIGIVRALMLVGCSTLTGFFVMAIATLIFQLGPQGYTSDPWVWLRGLIAFGIPCVYTAIHSARLIGRPQAAANVVIANSEKTPSPPTVDALDHS